MNLHSTNQTSTHRADAIQVGPIVRERVDGRERVTAVVDGVPVFFESADAELVPSVEAFASVFLIPALERGVRLALDEPPSATWLTNARQLVALFRTWWGYTGPDPLAGVASRPDTGARQPVGGQCFSGGIDSFFTLFRSAHSRQVLVFVHGFDVALSDERRMRACESSLRSVAAATGRRSILLRTSVRRHPLVRTVSWLREHGAVLAAAGHVLSGTIGSLVIPASWSCAWQKPWGSHWDSDPLWSSDRLQVIHDDASLERWDKVPWIADEPLFAEHLRVCWENLEPTGNCGRCEKCVRTRVVFERWACLDRFERAFAKPRPLEECLKRMAPLSKEQREWVWEPHYAQWPLAPEVHDAIVHLVERSRQAESPGPWQRAMRRLSRIAKNLRRLARRRQR